MKRLTLFVTTLLLLNSFAWVVHADNNAIADYPDCAKLRTHNNVRETDVAILQPILAATTEFMLATCAAFNEDDMRALNDRHFLTAGKPNGNRAELVKLLRQNFSDEPFPDISDVIVEWQSVDYTQALNSQLYSLNVIQGKRRDEYAFMLQSGTSNISFMVDDRMQQACLKLSTMACDPFFKEVERVTSVQNIFLGSNEIKQALVSTAQKRQDWHRFGEEGRFMTFIDIAFTSWIYSEEFSNGKSLPPPPKYQFFALRPSIAYEHFSAAESGDKDEMTLAVEWVGINQWDADIPWGVSIASVYADRSKGRKLGHGLMLHLNNKLSVGFANRGGGDNSVYINIDLLNWFSRFDAYASFKNAVLD